MKRILSFAGVLALVVAMSASAQTYPPSGTTQQTQTQQTTTPTDQTTTDQTTTTTETTTMDQENLPATASPLPLFGLAGLAALAGGLVLSRRRKV